MWNGDDKCAQVEQRAVMHECVYVCMCVYVINGDAQHEQGDAAGLGEG